MATPSARWLNTGLRSSSRTGLLELSPELILEIASHVISWNDLRSARRDSNSLGMPANNSSPGTGQVDLGNLRLVCRYFGEVLQRETFKSLVFDFHATRCVSAVDFESHLASLAQGNGPASRGVKLLLIRSLDSSQFGLGHSRIPISQQHIDEKMRAKAESIMRSMNIHLEVAVLSFQNLRCVAWKIEKVDTIRIRLMSALSSLRFLEDLTLHFEAGCKELSKLHINEFRCLHSLAVTFMNARLPFYVSSYPISQDQVIDHLSEVINRSPHLSHLSILQPQFGTRYDITFHTLMKKVSADRPLKIDSLVVSLPNIVLGSSTALVHHLKALKSIRIESYARLNTCSGSDLWGALAAAHIELENITVSYLSDALLKYLASYSGLKRLRILLTHFSFAELMRCDTRPFFTDILIRHSLSMTVDSDPAFHSNQCQYSVEDGLLFEARKQNNWHSAAPSSWLVRICIDSVPAACAFLLDCATKFPPEFFPRGINITYSPSILSFLYDTSLIHHRQSKSFAGRQWISDLEIMVHDVPRFPASIALNFEEYLLSPKKHKTGFYSYQNVLPEIA